MKDDYLINYQTVKELNLESFIRTIKSKKGKKLSELKVKDLTYHNGEIIYPGEGVYIFRDIKNDNKIILVGKVTSMSFTERISKHFDIRKNAWFNRLLKIVWENENPNIDTDYIKDENLIEISKSVFSRMDIVLINFIYEHDKSRKKIYKIEKLLRASTETLNKFKTIRIDDFGIIIDKY
jgi:hypothetical protein